MRYRLICLDVDGTLLDVNKRIPLPVKECLRRACREGLEIALISGRMPAALRIVDVLQEEGYEFVTVDEILFD